MGEERDGNESEAQIKDVVGNGEENARRNLRRVQRRQGWRGVSRERLGKGSKGKGETTCGKRLGELLGQPRGERHDAPEGPSTLQCSVEGHYASLRKPREDDALGGNPRRDLALDEGEEVRDAVLERVDVLVDLKRLEGVEVKP